MIANDYPISFPYGATTAPYTPTHPHRGDDRACPTGTPIVISGVTIGLTGHSGYVLGPSGIPGAKDGEHLHIQEWQGNVVTGIRKPQNAFKGGTVVNIDPTQTQGDGSFGKFITIRTSDGWNDSYCHLSAINVKIGDVLEGEDMPLFNEGDRVDFCVQAYGADNGYHKEFVDKEDFKLAIEHIMHSPQYLFETRTNVGDVANFRAKGITLPLNKVWKGAAYAAQYPTSTSPDAILLKPGTVYKTP